MLYKEHHPEVVYKGRKGMCTYQGYMFKSVSSIGCAIEKNWKYVMEIWGNEG